MFSTYGDGVQPDIRIGNTVLEKLKVRPHFYLEYPARCDTSWYKNLIHSPLMPIHKASDCDVELKGKCLEAALFPELHLKTAKSCKHKSPVVLTKIQRDAIFSGVENAVLNIVDMSPKVDNLLASGAYQANGSENEAELIIRAKSELLHQLLGEPAQRIKLLHGQVYDPNIVGLFIQQRKQDFSPDGFTKQLVRASSLIRKIDYNSQIFRYLKELSPQIKQYMDTDGAIRMSEAVSTIFNVKHSTFLPKVMVHEQNAKTLLELGDRDGAILMCMADIAATCARCWYFLCSSNDPSERVKELTRKFRVVIYNGDILKNAG